MATLNPTPNLSIQPEAPIAAPRTVDLAGAIAGLTGTLLGAATPPKAAKVSQAELDNDALKPFSEKVYSIINESDLSPSAQRKAVTALQREFARVNPRLADKAKTVVNDGFNMTDPVAEVRVDDAQTARLNEFKGTAGWAVANINAAASARDEDGVIDPDKYERAIEQEYFDWESRQAKIENLSKDLEVTNLTKQQRDTTSERLFEVAKPELDATVLAIAGELDSLYQQLQSGQPFVISGELARNLGVPEGEVSPENFPLYLKRYRASLKLQMRGRVLADSGLDSAQLTPASDAYYDTILAPIDAIILAADNSFKDAGETLKTIQDVDALNGYRALIPSIQKTLVFTKLLPPELRLEVFTAIKTTGIDSTILDMFNVLVANGGPGDMNKWADWANGDQKATSAEAAAIVLNKGTTDSTIFANTYKMHSVLSKGKATTDKEPANRYLSAPAFEKITTKSAKAVNEALSSDPEFATMWSQDISNDLGVTLQAAKNSMQETPWATIRVSSNGTVEAVLNEDALVELRPGASRDEEGLKATALGTDAVKLLQKKLQILKGFGQTGTDLIESVSLQTKQEAAPTPGQNVAPSARVSNGPIAQRYNLDFASLEAERGLPGGYLERLAMIESGGRADAKNAESSAGGLFQQIDSNAAEYGVTNRFNPNQSAGGAADFAEDNMVKLRRVLGRDPTGGELYLAHQQGGGGAAALLRNPDALAKDVLSEERVRLNLPSNMRGRTNTITSGEFANLWIDKFNKSNTTALPVSTGGQSTSATQQAPSTTPEGDQQSPQVEFSTPDQAPLSTTSRQTTVESTATAPEGGATGGVAGGEGGEATAPSKVTQEEVEKLSQQSRNILARLGIGAQDLLKFGSKEEARKAMEEGTVEQGDIIYVNGELVVL